MVVNESEALRWVTRQWQRLNGKDEISGVGGMFRVLQERTLEGRLFQVAGAAERKPRAPNEMLQRVTERRLAEADRRFLDGVCHWTRLARYGGYRYIYCFMGHCGNFEFDTIVNRQPM